MQANSFVRQRHDPAMHTATSGVLSMVYLSPHPVVGTVL
jgi:hypothetical protein